MVAVLRGSYVGEHVELRFELDRHGGDWPWFEGRASLSVDQREDMAQCSFEAHEVAIFCQDLDAIYHDMAGSAKLGGSETHVEIYIAHRPEGRGYFGLSGLLAWTEPYASLSDRTTSAKGPRGGVYLVFCDIDIEPAALPPFANQLRRMLRETEKTEPESSE